MRQSGRSAAAAAVALAALLAAGGAAAAEPVGDAAAVTHPSAGARIAAAPALPPLGRRAAGSALAAARGGTDTAAGSALPQAVLTGRLSDAQASNVASGSNTLAGGALAGMSGIPVVIQNTGNNVLIQNATVVNVTVR